MQTTNYHPNRGRMCNPSFTQLQTYARDTRIIISYQCEQSHLSSRRNSSKRDSGVQCARKESFACARKRRASSRAHA
eukprot:2486033-Amphidinium_carterae.2